MIKSFKKIISVLLISVIILSSVSLTFAAQSEIKNIIYMIPDGGGMAPFFLADQVKQAGGLSHLYMTATPVEKGEMYIKQYLIGAETTHSASSDVTDSAASGTALSSGYKTNNEMIGVSPDKKPHANILEACQELGKNTGIVSTYEWTNATPAAFSAHSESRLDTLNIATQVINQGIDVVIGNTLEAYTNQDWFLDKSFKDLGYNIINTKKELESVKAGDKVWGKLPQVYYDINKEKDTPNLAEITTAAIKALDDGNKNGFFLMVEGSAVDGAGHASSALEMVSEYLAFDAACKVAIEYAKSRKDTMVIIMPDHDTGGITIGSSYTNDALSAAAKAIYSGSFPQNIVWEGAGDHTGRNGGIFMYLPEGFEYPNGIDKSKASEVLNAFATDTRSCNVNRIDNTGITQYVSGLIGVDLNLLSQELFVDVTNKGTYNEAAETFTFTSDNGKDVNVKRNSAYAIADGETISTDGRISLFIDGKFYVPQALLNILDGKSATSNTAKYIVDKKYVIKEEIKIPTNSEENKNTAVNIDPSIASHWAAQALSKAVANGLIIGSDKGLEPDRNVTKAELITMMMRAIGIKNDQGAGPHWYSAAANKAVELGWTDYLGDITQDINRAASAGIIANAMHIDGSVSSDKEFKDVDEIKSTGYLNAVNGCVSLGIITGYPDGSFAPLKTITRAEAVVIIQRAYY